MQKKSNTTALKRKARNARHWALITLLEFHEKGQLILEPPSRFDRNRESSLYRLFVFTTVRHLSRLDRLIFYLTEKEATRLDPEVRVGLELGLAQAMTPERVKPHAALHETVELMTWLGHDKLKGFINANLRRYQREETQLTRRLGAEPAAIFYSHPVWMVERWQAQYGKTKTTAILQANQEQADMHLVIRPGLDPEVIRAELRQGGVEMSPTSLAVEQAQGLFDLQRFVQGDLLIQDISGQKLVRLLADLPKESLLDACASPGGKLFHMEWLYSQQMQRMVGLELEEGRMQRLEDNHERLKSKAELVMGDAKQPPLQEQFQLVLADVPCSATGVIQKHPEIKWCRKPEDFKTNQQEQLALLGGLAPLVAAGGHLVYSTCSLEQEENQEVVSLFLGSHPEFQLKPFAPGDEITPEGYFQALPRPGQMGAFGAVLAKNQP